MKDRINAIVGALESWAIDLEQGRQVWIPASTLRSAAKALSEHPAQPESEAVRAAWMAGYTECEREAIEKAQQQEPVGYWQGKFSEDGGATLYEVPQVSYFGRTYPNIPLYTSPPESKPWVGLTDEEWRDIADDRSLYSIAAIKSAIEAKLRENNA